MNREGGASDATQGTGPTHRPLPVCASLPLYRERHEQHHERHHEQHMTSTMSLPLFADGVGRNQPPEFAHYHGVPADLFSLHTPPEKPSPSDRRRSRCDQTGWAWLLRYRRVTTLTAIEAVISCHSGATLTYRRQNVLAVETAPITKPTPEIANEVVQIAKPTPEAIEIAKRLRREQSSRKDHSSRDRARDPRREEEPASLKWR